MSYHVIPVRGDTGKVVRALIIQAETGAAEEVLAAHDQPQFVPRLPDERGRSVEDRLATYLDNTTAFAPDRSHEVIADTHDEALDEADRMLAVDERFVYRPDFSADDLHHFDDACQALTDVADWLRQLRTMSLVDVLESSHQAERRALEGLQEVRSLALRPLTSRRVAASFMSGADDTLRRCGLSKPIVARLEDAGITTRVQLARTPDKVLKKIPMLGPQKVAQIRAKVPFEADGEVHLTRHRGVIVEGAPGGGGSVRDRDTGEVLGFEADDLPPEAMGKPPADLEVEFAIWRDHDDRRAIHLRLL